MYLQHLSISGFKSFAKKGELEFAAPITAIVGPNGSGKSNVAESFRFVLGEQSLKSMRGKKGEDLIFNGSNTASRSNRAAVTVSLNNKERVFPLDFDEIVVERTVHRDGQNEYSINGSKVRLKDVQELLSAANIGPTGHHIISQGEADRILSASDRERREMVEDALGLKVFQYKKQEAEKKLKKTEENIERVQSQRREVAPHLKFLERQVKKIERALELRQQLSIRMNEYLKREDVYLAHHVDRLTIARKAPEAKLHEIATQLEEATATVEQSEDKEATDKLSALESELTTVRQQRQQLLRQSGQLEGQQTYVERRVKELESQASSPTDAPVPISEVRSFVAGVEKEIEKSINTTDSTGLTRALKNVLHACGSFVKNLTATTTIDTSKEEKELQEIEKELVRIAKEVEQVIAKETDLTKAYNDAKDAIETARTEEREAERTVFTLTNQQRECEGEIARIDAELRVLERDREEFKRELQEGVTLIGRGIAQYFNQEITEGGKEVSRKELVSEAREKQRERRRELEKLKIRLEEVGGVDDDIEKEYKEVKERDEFLAGEIADLEASVVKLEALIADLTTQLNEQFVAGIDKIAVEFQRFFALMFGGGEAKLVREKPKTKRKRKEANEFGEEVEIDEEIEDESAQEGISIDVKLPNKKVRGLEMLSGGERALTSIALIFAMSQVNPPLFIILDETDAALDEANSRRYGDMIEALAEKSQLILITHNRETMSRAGVLYGVTMAGDGVSKLLSVQLDEAMAVAK